MDTVEMNGCNLVNFQADICLFFVCFFRYGECSRQSWFLLMLKTC